MFEKSDYDKFRVVLDVSAHSSLGLHKDNLISYIEYKLNMDSRSRFNVVNLDNIKVDKVGGVYEE